MIPRLVHRVWLGDEPEPEWTRPFADTWRQPGWLLRQWSGPEELYPLRNQAIYDRAPELAPNHVGQLRADILRYEILERYGGVYVDADFECLRPIDGLLEGVECFAAWEEQGKWVANGLLGCITGHPFVERLINAIPASVSANRGRRPNRMTGPHLITRLQREHPQELRVLDQALVFPYSWREIADHGPGEECPGAVCVHHWLNQRREQGVPVCPS